jgi:type IV pilus assembly protein PilB
MIFRRRSSLPPTPAPAPVREGPRLGDLLLDAGLLSEEQLAAALEAQRDRKKRLGEILVEDGIVDEVRLADLLSHQLKTPLVDLRDEPSTPEALALLAYADATRLGVLPLTVDAKTLILATDDPGNLVLLREVAKLTGREVRPHLAIRSKILEAIRGRYRTTADLSRQVSAFAEAHPTVDPEVEVTAGGVALADAPIVQIVNLLVAQALRDRASDLHIEPQPEHLRVRARVDGILHDVSELPLHLGPGLVSRIKIMADLNIVEKQRAQDGQFSMEVDGRAIDVRVSCMRTIWGEKAVLRLLDKARSVFELGELGMPAELLPGYRRLLGAPSGMIVVAGPTGSGKTTTLYASINELDRAAMNVATIEDPVEYTFQLISQTQVNAAAGITFASGLRAILRQDPDIILVGEVRDRETAEIAVQASLTGHLVLSSMHSTDATGVLFRMLEMGIEPYLVAASMTGVLAERLMRRICSHCRLEVEPTIEERQIYHDAGVEPPSLSFLGRGCNYCAGTGYLDRVGAYELLTLDPQIRRLLTSGARYDELRQQAIEGGMVPLRVDALRKAAAGVTTVPEALRAVA